MIAEEAMGQSKVGDADDLFVELAGLEEGAVEGCLLGVEASLAE